MLVIGIGPAVLVGIMGLWLLTDDRPQRPKTPPPGLGEEAPPPGVVVTEVATAAPPRDPAAGGGLPGESILRGYGDPGTPPAHDLELMARAIDNFLLVSKGLRDRPLSTNGEWAAALRGQRPGSERWLPDRHPAFDAEGRLIDRWGSPLFFHALGGQRWEIRSAGPDRRMWSDDDLKVDANGR